MHVAPPRSGAKVTAFGSTYTMKADSTATAGAYSLVEEEFWGDPTPLHRHLDAEEAFYVLSGQVAVWVEAAERVVGPDTFLLVPRGAAHALRRAAEEPVRMLTLVSPPGLQDFFTAVAREGESALVADPPRLARLAVAFGSEILGEYPVGDRT